MTRSQADGTLPLPPSTPTGGILVEAPHLFIVVVAGRPARDVLRTRLDGIDTIEVGRGETTEVRDDGHGRLALSIDDPHMSSKHAVLQRRHGTWTLVDAGSSNGTFVGAAGAPDVRVSPERSHDLRDGDWLQLGQTLLRFRASLLSVARSPRTMVAGRDERGLTSLLPDLEVMFHEVAALAREPFGTVLIKGETGTGKELLARALHDLSGRNKHPFVAINCGSLREHPRSELFGVEADAFTDVEGRQGLIRRSRRGTLFFDEVGKLPLDVQDMLLRLLSSNEIHAAGADTIEIIPTRELNIVFAANEDLGRLVQEERFRADLLARIGTHVIELPPLRDRKEDLGLVLSQLLHELSAPGAMDRALDEVTFSVDALRVISRGDWPWNIRGLREALRAALRPVLRGASHAIQATEFEKALHRQHEAVGGLDDGAPRDLSQRPGSATTSSGNEPGADGRRPPVAAKASGRLSDAQRQRRDTILELYASVVVERGKYGAKAEVARRLELRGVSYLSKEERRLDIDENDYQDAILALRRRIDTAPLPNPEGARK